MGESPSHSEVVLSDPLSSLTRKERKGLLVASVVALVIAKTGLIPQRITALGVEFGAANQAALLLIAQYVVLFMLIAFLVYSLSDFALWKTLSFEAWLNTFKQSVADRKLLEEHEAFIFEKVADKARFWWLASKPIVFIRCLFDFILPIVISLFAIHALWVARQQSLATPIPGVSTSAAPSTQPSNKP